MFARWEYQRVDGESGWNRRFIDQTELGAPIPDLGIVGRLGEGFGAPAYADDQDARRLIVEALVAEVRPLGREEQHGSTVWRYGVDLAGEGAADRVPEPIRSEMRAWGEDEGPDNLDLWLDGRGRLRRISLFSAFGDEGGFRVENEFWDWGGPGRLDLPSDLDDETAEGGDGESSVTLEPGLTLDESTPNLTLRVSDNDEPGTEVGLHVDGRREPAGEELQAEIRMMPAAGRHLAPGEYRFADLRVLEDRAPFTFDVLGADLNERCAPNRPRSGALTLIESVMYREEFYVRLHLRFSLTCEALGGGPPISLAGEARYHALT